MGRKRKVEEGKRKVEEDNEGVLVGRKVQKHFKGFGVFTGEIIAYNASRGFYKIVYEDGDREELEAQEVQAILADLEESSSRLTDSGSKRGRYAKRGAESRQKDNIRKEQGGKRQKRELQVREETLNETGRRINLTGVELREESSRRNTGGQSGQSFRDEEENKETTGADGSVKDERQIDGDVPQSLRITRSSKRKRRDETEKSEEHAPPSKSNYSNGYRRNGNRLRRGQKLLESSEDDESDDDSEESSDFEEGSSDDDSLSSESSESSDDDLDERPNRTQETPPEELKLPPLQTLPSSSGDFVLPDESVAEVFAVYSFLRSFSRALFLSPFCLDDFVRALTTETADNLIDSVHVSLLQALRRNLLRLSNEGSKVAKNCLRQPDWNMLDAITWPSYLIAFLATHGFSITSFGVLGREYYKVAVGTKLAVLSFLCDHVMDTEEIRAELDMRELECTSLSRQDRRRSIAKVTHTPHSVEPILTNEDKASLKDLTSPGRTRRSLAQYSAGETRGGQMHESQDWNSDECVLCGMDGNLICCDGCPAAYHARCVGISRSSLLPGDWFCPECIVQKIGGEQSMRVEGLRGADLLGVDPYGRTFMSTCGYLLVLESYGDSKSNHKYYNVNDLPGVLQTLEMMKPFCDSILKAILQHWNITDWKPVRASTDLGIEAETGDVMGSVSDDLHEQNGSVQQLGEILPASVCPGNLSQGVQETSNIVVASIASESNGEQLKITDAKAPQPKFPDLTVLETDSKILEGRPGATANGILNKKLCNFALDQDPYLAQKLNNRDFKGRFVTGVSHEYSQPEQFHKSGLYINHYFLGDTAATAAANLALVTSEENCPTESKKLKKKTRATTTAEQLKAFYQAPVRFYWPSFKKRFMETPKERCGWCFCCHNPNLKRGCLLNQVATNLAAGAACVAGGIRPSKAGPGHLSAVAGYLLHIEDNFHSLLVGPWENIHFRKLWRKKVEQAVCVRELKTSLLELESNLRSVVFSEDWSKCAEDAPSMFLGGSTAAATNETLSRKGSSRKSAQRAGTSARRRISSTGGSTLGTQWWWHGKVAHKVLAWQILPNTVARKAGRQGGLKKIAGLTYMEGREVPKRSKQCAWRTRVQSACTIAELAVQVRCLDAQLRWGDLASKVDFLQLDTKCEDKDNIPTEKPAIHAKSSKGGVPLYLVDSTLSLNQGSKHSLSSSQSQASKGIRLTELSSGEKQVWVDERQVPLSLLRDFEERDRLLRQSKLPKLALLQKQLHFKVRKVSKKDVFNILMERAGLSSKPKLLLSLLCKYCNSKVLASLAVQCQVCQAPFHKDCTTATNLPERREMKRTCHRCLHVAIGDQSSHHNLVVRKKFSDCSQVPNNGPSENTSGVESLLSSGIGKQYSSLEKEGYAERTSDDNSMPLKVTKDQYSQFFNKPASVLQRNPDKNPSTEGVYWRRNGMECKTISRDKLVLPGQVNTQFSVAPKCCLCRQQYSRNHLYIRCEYCPLWFHGDAFGVTERNIGEVMGLKCHKCQKKNGPSCPYGKNDEDNFGKSVILDHGEVIDAAEGRKLRNEYFLEMKTILDPQMSNQVKGQSLNVVSSAPHAREKIPSEHVTVGTQAEYEVFSGGLVDLKGNSSPQKSNEIGSWSLHENVATVNMVSTSASPVFVEAASERATVVSKTQIPCSGGRFQIDGKEPFENSEEKLTLQKGCEQILETYDTPEMMKSVQTPLSGEGLTCSWNAETCPRATLSFTELLSSEDDWVEELAKVAMDFGNNWSESSHLDSLMDTCVHSQFTENGIAASIGSEAQNLDGTTSGFCGGQYQFLEGDHGYKYPNDLKVSTLALEEAKRITCAVCSDGGVAPDVECIGCGVAVHRQCFEWSPVGVWTGYGWACDSCKAGFLQGQDISTHCMQLIDSRILLQS